MRKIGYAILWLLEYLWLALSRLFRRRALVDPHWPGERPATKYQIARKRCSTCGKRRACLYSCGAWHCGECDARALWGTLYIERPAPERDE